MSIVIDLNQACLVCLQDGVQELHSIFEFDHQTNITIAEKIALCSVLQTPSTANSKLPDKICARCISDLGVVWTFQRNCKTANSIFHMLLQEGEEEVPLLELDEQKIKLPNGLNIKRVAAESISILPMAVVNSGEHSEIADYNIREALVDTTTDEQQIDMLVEEEIDSNEQFDEDVLDEYEYDGEVTFLEEGDAVDDTKNFNAEGIEENVKLKIDSNIQESEEDNESMPQSLKEEQTITDDEDENLMNNFTEPITKNIKQTEKTTNKNHTSKVNKTKPRKTKTNTGIKRPQKICEICGNTYKYQHALNAHMRRHTNTRPFTCEFCDKAFITNVELRRHLRVHTRQKPHACQYCDRRFSDFGSRIKHERSHTGERPYLCYCGKSFAYPHVLSVHIRTHTGEKKFKCTECGKGFTKKIYLQSHMEQHTRTNGPTSSAKGQRKNDSERNKKGAIISVIDDDQVVKIEDGTTKNLNRDYVVEM